MYARSFQPPGDQSYFLFGPRGTGKTTWVKKHYSSASYVDLLASETYRRLLAEPERLRTLVPEDPARWTVIDEIQKIPQLLNEVHRLIELGHRFVLTGSSARKLRSKGVNLLAGRALTCRMHPLTAQELGADFSLERGMHLGCLPSVFTLSDPRSYLESYVTTYLKEEVQQEGLTRDLGVFSRFLEAASFSQASTLNMSAVARECSVARKVVEGYFVILEDLLLARRVPVFTRRARRKMASHPKFYLFDAGVYRTIRPSGPLDRPEEIDGAALETLVLQQILAQNDNHRLGYAPYYWRTHHQQEVDIVLYGDPGLVAIEVKRSKRIRKQDLAGLRAFVRDYPMARPMLLYGGTQRFRENGINVLPVSEALPRLLDLLAPAS